MYGSIYHTVNYLSINGEQVVYKGWHLKLDNLVSVKVLRMRSACALRVSSTTVQATR